MTLTPADAFNALKTLYPNTIRIEKQGEYTKRYWHDGSKERAISHRILDILWNDTAVYPIPLEKVLKLGYSAYGYYISTDEGPKSKYLHYDGVMRNSTNHNGESFGYYNVIYNALASAYRYNHDVLIKLDQCAVSKW